MGGGEAAVSWVFGLGIEKLGGFNYKWGSYVFFLA